MPFGILDTQYIDFPQGVDVAYIRGLSNRAGVPFTRILSELNSRLAALNGSRDELVAALIGVTTETFAETGRPTQFDVDERGEYTIARAQLVEGQAHMLPISHFDVSLEFTEDGLMAMRLSSILLNIDSLVGGFRRLYRIRALQRLFMPTEIRVDKKTAVRSPGYAGSGTGLNAFGGSYPNGAALPGGYSHYFVRGAATFAATLKAARDRLARWHKPPYDLVAPASEIALITAINPGNPSEGFVTAGSLLVRPPQADAVASVDASMYLGVLFGNIRVRPALDDFTDPYTAIFKSYGAINSANPLLWRYDEMIGRNAYVRYRTMFPLDQSVALQSFGIGVGDRTGAVLVKNDTGTYDGPVIV